MTPTSDILLQQVRDGFKDRQAPKKLVIDEAVTECEDTDLNFSGTTWMEQISESISLRHGSLWYFTPPAFCYYLPAFLISAIQWPSCLFVLDHIVAQFDPSIVGARAAVLLTELTERERRATVAVLTSRDGEVDDQLQRIICSLLKIRT